jgi:predicted RNase H-like nuclease (RuvC/YqgF family)
MPDPQYDTQHIEDTRTHELLKPYRERIVSLEAELGREKDRAKLAIRTCEEWMNKTIVLEAKLGRPQRRINYIEIENLEKELVQANATIDELQSTLGGRTKTTRLQRTGIVLSVIWLILVGAWIAGSKPVGAYPTSSPLPPFLFLGVLPLLIGWGIWWIRR